MTKQCEECQKELPFSYFSKQRGGFMGLRRVCRSCEQKKLLLNEFI